MATAVDPTYPLYPIACILAAAMLPLVLLTSFIRQNWILGVAFLCFWVFWENLTLGLNAIIWSDNADVKLYVYCDIVTHMQVITGVVRPMATLIITRRLYLIASLRSVELPGKAEKRRNTALEWTLGFKLVIPVLVAGPIYYIVQQVRFAVFEGFGCENSLDSSLLGILLVTSWGVFLPLLSIVIYYPRVIRIFYHQKRDMDQFLQSNDSVSRVNYFRIFALASIDVILTLPIGIANIVLLLSVTDLTAQGRFPIYSGWTSLHTDWEPTGVPYADLMAGGTSSIAQLYFSQWTSPVLSFVIFGLLGITAEARGSYWRVFCTFGGWFGWKPAPHPRKARSPLGTMEFGERPQDTSFNLDIESHPSYIDPNARAEQVLESGGGQAPTRELESSSHSEIAEEPRVVSNEEVNTGYHGEYDPDGAKSVDASNTA